MKEPIKVIVTVPWGEPGGGAETMLLTFLRHVRRSHVEPVVVLLQPGTLQEELAALEIRTFVVPAGRLRDLPRFIRTVRSLSELFRREKPGLLLNWSPKAQVYGAIAARLAGRADRVAWWQHGVPTGHWLDRLATWLPASAVGCSSHYSAGAQQRCRPRRPTFVVHPGIDAPDLAPSAEFRERLGIAEDALLAGIVGRLQPWKGQHRFILALSRLRQLGHRVHGLVVGGTAYGLSPEYEPYLRQLVVEHELSDTVTFVGQVRDPLPYVRALDVLVNASLEEPFGIVLLEGMALGVPVIAFARGGPAEIIEPGKSGLLVRGATSDALADALRRLLVAPELRRSLADGGSKRFRASFTGERLARDMEHILVSLGDLRSTGFLKSAGPTVPLTRGPR